MFPSPTKWKNYGSDSACPNHTLQFVSVASFMGRHSPDAKEERSEPCVPPSMSVTWWKCHSAIMHDPYDFCSISCLAFVSPMYRIEQAKTGHCSVPECTDSWCNGRGKRTGIICMVTTCVWLVNSFVNLYLVPSSRGIWGAQSIVIRTWKIWQGTVKLSCFDSEISLPIFNYNRRLVISFV